MATSKHRDVGLELLAERASLKLTDATVVREGTAFVATLPVQNGTVSLRFTEISSSRQSVDAVLSLRLNVTDGTYPPFVQRIDLRSASARKGLATDLNAAYGDKKVGYNWVLMLNIAFNNVIEAIKREQQPQTAMGVSYAEVPFLLKPFLQENVSNILYASSEVGKTWFALSLGVSLATGHHFLNYDAPKGKKTLYLDYEDDFRTFVNRLHKLCGGMGVDYEEVAAHMGYYKPVGSLRTNVELIRDMVVNDGYDLIIIDAGGDAAGGSPSDEEKVLDLFNALDEIRATRLILHHEPKNVINQDAAYYGSTYWKARSRVGWRLKVETRQGNNVLICASLEKKSNLGYIEPIYYWMRYEDDEIARYAGQTPTVSFERPTQDEVNKLLTKGDDGPVDLLEALSEPMTVKQLKDATGLPMSTVSRVVYDLWQAKKIERKREGREFVYVRVFE